MDRTTKDKMISDFQKLVNKPITGSSAFAGLNMCDIYLNIKDREYVLSTLQQRFPHATGDLSTAEDWAAKLESLQSDSTYISNFAGQVGEDKAVETLEKLGIHTKPFDSLTHKDNDLQSIDGGVDWSVKSYNDLDSFNRVVSEHPASDHYVVNSEIFEKLGDSGDLQDYSNSGITIIDGQFSHIDNVNLAEERLGAITGDITDEIYDGFSDDIPIVAGIVTLCNIGIDLYKYKTGQSSKTEAYKDVLNSVGKITAASGGAAAGGALGASIGTAIFPLAGTFIGGGVGAFLGAMGVREIIEDITDYWKYGDTNAAYKYFSNKFDSDWPMSMNTKISEKYYYNKSLKRNITLEENKLKKYKSELDISDPSIPTIKSVLIGETIKRLNNSIKLTFTASKKVQDKLITFCIEAGLKKFQREREKSKNYTQLMYGSFIAENSSWLLDLNSKEKEIISKMNDEISNSPNNQFKLNHVKQEIFGTIAISNLTEGG